jgi:hypothetical protein
VIPEHIFFDLHRSGFFESRVLFGSQPDLERHQPGGYLRSKEIILQRIPLNEKLAMRIL